MEGVVKVREIKFRAWDKNSKKMIHNVAICCGRFFDMFENELRDYELMQYTGFNIKNEEIYEGDILQITLEDDVETLVDVGTVQMNNEGCWVVYVEGTDSEDLLWDWVTENIKVIGNIYENPELLEVAEC